MYKLTLFCCAFLLFFSCENVDNYESENTEDTTTDTVQEEETASAVGEADFNTYWEDFLEQKNNADFVKSQCIYPVYKAGFQNETLSEADFHNVFEAGCMEGSIKVKPVSSGNMVAFLEENFMKAFGNLDNIFQVYCEPSPTGLSAFFKFEKDSFKLIGYEEIEIAD